MNTNIISQQEAQIPQLIEKLGDYDGETRQQARSMLVQIGQESIPALLEAINSPNVHVRWEAIQALGEFHDPATATALTTKLMDDDTGVRWVAMEGLIELGRASLRPLLESFIANFDSAWLREGVHHILRVLKDRHALNDREIILFKKLDQQFIPGVTTGWTSEQAWAAERALELLDRETN